MNYWSITVVALLSAACATTDRSFTAHVREPDREAVRRQAEIRRLTAERVDHARELARASVEHAVSDSSEAGQRAALARAWGLASSALTDRTPGNLAALAPSVLRVYDLGAALADGPDAPEEALSAATPRVDAPIDGGQAVLRRIAAQLRASDPGLWEGDTLAEPVGECLLVLQRPEHFPAVERDLDRLATTGGGFTRVRMTTIPGAGEPDPEGRWTAVDYDAGVAAARAAGHDVRELTLDIPFGRARGAIDGVQASYVQDFDVDAPSGMADPKIGTLRTGVVISGTYSAPERDGVAWLDLEVGRSAGVEPIPEFTTLIEPGAEPVTIQIPEIRVEAYRNRVAPTRVGAGRAILGRSLRVTDPTSGERDILDATPYWVYVHTQAHGTPTEARPGWKRVSPDPTPPRFAAPLLEQAAPLAALYLAENDQRFAAAEIRNALVHAEGHVWRRRLRVSPDVQEGVLVRWPSPAPDADTERALQDSMVTRAAGCGFVEVRNGLVIALVTPESAGAVARVLGALERAQEGSVPQVAFDDADEDEALRRTATEQVSFVQDFDVQVAQNAALADPIIGVMVEGAVAEARPVPSAGPGVYDVRMTHAAVHQPIREFTTSLSRGAPVTIQLPRLHIRTTWRRVVLRRGESETMETRVGTGEEEDVRRFVLRAIN